MPSDATTRRDGEETPDALRVCDIGEQGLLARLRRFCPAGLIGDDAALLTLTPGQSLVVSEDVLVDGVHFSLGLAAPERRTTAPYDVGWRAAAANLSDLAAMGAIPLGLTVGLSLPGEIPVAWVEALYEGMVACLHRYGVDVIGGDICRSPVVTVAIAILGEVNPTCVIRRSLARPGDAIVVTGVHGASRAGLELLLHPERGSNLRAGDREALIQAHQRPIPRLDVIPVLRSLFTPPTAVTLDPALTASLAGFRVGGMDSSDGLADAVLQICRASQVGAVLHRSALPLPPAFTRWLSPAQAMEWALYGGEDFELVLCLAPDKAAQLVQQVPGSVCVGTITADTTVVVRDPTGSVADDVLRLDRGFQHF